MALGNVYSDLASGTNPEYAGCIIFRYEDITLPDDEGTLRITMWRGIDTTLDCDNLALGGTPKTSDAFAYVGLKTNILSSLPVIKEKAERYFGEPQVDGFDLSIYDTADVSDISFVPDRTGKVLKYNMVLEEAYDGRLFSKYMKPDDSSDLFCKIEIKDSGEETFREWVRGVLQNSYDAEEVQLAHNVPASQSLAYKDYDKTKFDNDNYETDADRVWNLKFVPVGMNAFARVPVMPHTNVTGVGDENSTWSVTFHDRDASPISLTYDQDADADGVPVEQKAADVIFKDSLNATQYATYAHHINARLWLNKILDAALGDNNWELEADDSPLSFYTGQLGANHDRLSNVSVFPKTFNPASTDKDKWMLIPLTMFGVRKEVDPNGQAEPAPVPECTWDKRFKNQWECLLEFCYLNGLVPRIDQVMRTTNGVTRSKTLVKLAKRQASENEFSTLVPVSSSLTAYPEGEEGIQITLEKTFRNADTQHGWFDDWFATHTDTAPYLIDNTLIKPQKNGYAVPSVSKNPNELKIGMCWGSGSHRTTAFGQNFLVVGWYGCTYEDYHTNNTAAYLATLGAAPHYTFRTGFIYNAADQQYLTEHFPTVAPLMHVTNDTWCPIVRGSFQFLKTDGTNVSVSCVSLKQLLSRYYAHIYVKSTRKYVRKYSTVTKFKDMTEGSATLGKSSWRFARIFDKTKIQGSFYYLHSRETDFNSMETTCEYLKLDDANKYFDGTDWLDSGNDKGTEIGDPPETH